MKSEHQRRWLDNAKELADAIPSDFVVGVATAAFQIEGATRDGGRGESVWDTFSHQSGRIQGGGTADVATDHYHRYKEDVGLIRELGASSYRFSLAWTRLQPDGRGPANRDGVAFYDRLLDELLAAGISPMATIHHWDTPDALPGSWMNRDTAYRFSDLAELVGDAFGDRIDNWVTINEPATVTLNGYALGVHAPGETLLFDALPSAHHQLLGHGLAVQALRSTGVSGGIGIANVHSPVEPAGDSEPDAIFAELFDLIHNRVFADPVLLGRYPEVPEYFQEVRRFAEEIDPADLVTISQPLDFYGLNYYLPSRIRAGSRSASTPDGEAAPVRSLPFHLVEWPEYGRTGFGWPIAPDYLDVALRELRDRYGEALPPVYITEGGASFPDELDRGGRVRDPKRIEYLGSHLHAALTAVAPGGAAEGVDLRGYFVWSLLDGFEWAAGFTQRFGLVHVDFSTRTRTPKDSYRWLQRVIESRS